jgi:diadenosine tetraphosphate (Ap4A) HIT family hydrolase
VSCPFCKLEEDRIIIESEHAVAFYDNFPISLGHMLIIPLSHVNSIFELNPVQLSSLMETMRVAAEHLDANYQPDGYNIGINEGEAAGQTVSHFHIHLIPRYLGDQEDPRGGVRWIFPDKAKYWEDKVPEIVYCPNCIFYDTQCTVEERDWELPCGGFKSNPNLE